jgi:MFS family permease
MAAARPEKPSARMMPLRDSKIQAGIVSALGMTQIIGYGTLSLLIGGLSATYIGKQTDRVGAATVLTVGSALSALTLAMCAWSPSVFVFGLAIILLEVSSGMVQYQAAFAALVQSDPRTASRSITYLTLIGGFASTIFWPISTALLGYLTWREIYLVFAALNLFVCMPLHLWITGKGKTSGVRNANGAGEHVVGAVPPETRRGAMIVVSAAFAILGFTLASILAHMVPMLGDLGLGTAAVVVGSLWFRCLATSVWAPRRSSSARCSARPKCSAV